MSEQEKEESQGKEDQNNVAKNLKGLGILIVIAGTVGAYFF